MLSLGYERFILTVKWLFFFLQPLPPPYYLRPYPSFVYLSSWLLLPSFISCSITLGYGGGGGGGYQGGGGGSGACYAFQKGECTRGSGCRFSHDGGGGGGKSSVRKPTVVAIFSTCRWILSVSPWIQCTLLIVRVKLFLHLSVIFTLSLIYLL